MRNSTLFTLLMLALTIGVGSVLARLNTDAPQFIGVVNVEPEEVDTLAFDTLIVVEDYDWSGDSVVEEVVAVPDYDWSGDTIAGDAVSSVSAMIANIVPFTDCNLLKYENLSTEVLEDLYVSDNIDACGTYVLGMRAIENATTDEEVIVAIDYLIDSSYAGYTKAMVMLASIILSSDDSDQELSSIAGELLLKAYEAGDEDAEDIVRSVFTGMGKK